MCRLAFTCPSSCCSLYFKVQFTAPQILFFLLTISSAVEFMKLPGYLMVESLSHHIISWSLSCSSLHDHPPGDRQMSLGEFIIS